MNDHTPDTVGVDISKAHLDLHRRSTGESARFANDASVFEELAAWVGDGCAAVVYESTGPWHREFEERLAGRLPLARVNALRARRFAQAMGEEAKTDAVDARMLAAMGAAVDVRPVEPRAPAQRNLDELIAARDAPHGFRSSFKDWARNHGIDHELSELCLAHVEGSKTVPAYARDDLLEKRRPVMQQWADYLDEGAWTGPAARSAPASPEPGQGPAGRPASPSACP